MKLIIIIILFAGIKVSYTIPITRIQRQATTTPPPESEDDYGSNQDDESQRSLQRRTLAAIELLPETIPRKRAKIVLRRALELLEKPKRSSQTSRQRSICQGHNVDQEAKNILRLITGEETIGSTSEESQSMPSQESSSCTDYSQQDEIYINGTNRVIAPETMEKILALHDAGQSERSIKGKYKWFCRRYIPRMREYLDAGGTLLRV